MSNVLQFTGPTTLDLPIEQVLDAAKGRIEGAVLVLGWHKDGSLYAASSSGDAKESLWLAQQFTHSLLNGGYE